MKLNISNLFHISSTLVRASSAYFKETKEELLKVTWPTRKEVIAHTAIVIITVLIAAAIIALIDYGLIQVIKTFVLKG